MNPKHWRRFFFLSALILLALSIPGAAAAAGGTLTSGEEVSQSRVPERISAGGADTCGIKTDGTVACWGRSDEGQTAEPGGTFTEVSAGFDHTCGVRTNGTIFCWGWNVKGQAPVVSLSPATLPNGTVGQAYNQTLSASGGVAPVHLPAHQRYPARSPGVWRPDLRDPDGGREFWVETDRERPA